MRGGELTALCFVICGIGLLIVGKESPLVLTGCFIGVLTGLIPGLHINLFLPFVGTGMTAFIVGLVVSHSFFDFIPAILIGAPDEGAALSVLPSHKMLLKGKALEAFRLTIVGGLLSGIVAIAAIPLLGFVKQIQWLVPIILIIALLAMISSTKRKVETILIMLASALLGLVAFEHPNGLPSILSGFFGASTIIYSIRGRKSIPPQKPHADVSISPQEIGLGASAGLLAGLFPAISSSVAATMVCPRMRHRQFLAVLGGTNTVYAFAAILAIHIIGKPRSGAAITIANEPHSLFWLVGISLIALGVSAWLAWSLSKTIVASFNQINYRLASAVALFIVISLNMLMGLEAMAMMAVATIIGLVCLHIGARRSSCMASLLIPVLLFYLL